MIAISRLAGLILAHRLEAEAAGQNTATIDDFYKRFQEFRSYVYRNIGSLASHRRRGERLSTAHVESTVNQLINQRMCKKRQMRWSRNGAQFLNVRTAHLTSKPPPWTKLIVPQVCAGVSRMPLNVHSDGSSVSKTVEIGLVVSR
ncbi:hypothetical protein JQK88_34950 [Mesorhizobium caraganae]|uniref:hypothetical protein n=1 Tax=Mesorhizobium caraganae TaxID=483206 RepID=UPI001939D06F|nr:hypothetical protein [Mesorhizobium caraganae]MBM2716266.1 hypothetical protein [Mesorhizobium caraganae]